jgi:putative membrane protein
MGDFFNDNLTELPEFLMFFGIAAVLVVIFVGVYSTVTRHNELKLIKEKSTAAAIAFSGSLIGFALPLASALENSVTIFELMLWGIVALIVQIIIYLLVRLPMPRISDRITENEVAAGIWLGATSLVGGILNAASMTS